MTSWTLEFIEPDLSRMTLTSTRCLLPLCCELPLLAVISSSPVPVGSRPATAHTWFAVRNLIFRGVVRSALYGGCRRWKDIVLKCQGRLRTESVSSRPG